MKKIKSKRKKRSFEEAYSGIVEVVSEIMIQNSRSASSLNTYFQKYKTSNSKDQIFPIDSSFSSLKMIFLFYCFCIIQKQKLNYESYSLPKIV